MRLYSQFNIVLALALILSVLLSHNHVASAIPQSDGNSVSSAAGGLLGATAGAVSGALSEAKSGQESSNNGGNMQSSSGPGSSSQGSGSGSMSASASGSGSASISGSMSGSSGTMSGSVATSGSSSGGSSQASSASLSVSTGSTTPKPEGGLISKMKDMFKESKEVIKNSVENLTGIGKDEKKDGQMGSSTPKPEGGLVDKMSDMAKKGKEVIEQKKESMKESFESKKESFKESFENKKEAVKDLFESKKDEKKEERNDNKNNKDEKKKGDSKEGENRDGPVEKVTQFVSRGTEALRDTVHKVEDKAHDIGEKVKNVFDENITKPMSSASGSGRSTEQGQMTSQAAENSKLRGSEREKHLVEAKKRQEGEFSRPNSLKEVVQEAKSRGVIPQNEDRSALRGNHDDEKSITVEVLDKAHEMSKIPVETILRPLDKMLGYEKDPLVRIYDNSHELLRKPLGLMAKPVESMLTGAFKTTDEAKKDYDKLLLTTSEQERKEAKMKEEKSKMADRSVVGEIADKTMELATKPFEIVLKPFDHVMGFDKDGKKNPLLKTLDSLYSYSKRPVDAMAKPFESILRKMADSEQMYQVSVRLSDNTDPKLITRLADGALNIADRVITRPLEIVMKPLNHALGFDEPGRKNPIVEAAHSLKNATKVGVELFTKPIDRIIKEIADLGDNRNDAELEAEYERQKEEASRIVRAMDKFHDAAQFPFEIVLRPVSKVLGTNKEGRKEPFLRAWDIIHQIVRTPIQVISKPVEDAILGSKPKKQKSKSEAHSSSSSSSSSSGSSSSSSASASTSSSSEKSSGSSRSSISGSVSIGKGKIGGTISTGSSSSGKGFEMKKNIITDNIKKVEKLATKPLDVITSPIRRLILGEDNEKVGSDTEKNNREIQAKSRSGYNKGSNKKGDKQPDKIITTIEKMNNVFWKPLELITQPISDILAPGHKEKKDSNQAKGKERSASK